MNEGSRKTHRENRRPSVAAFFGFLHDRVIYQRRIHSIAKAVNPLIPAGILLDVGIGNGDLPRYLMTLRSDVKVVGLDVLIRVRSGVPTVEYGGKIFPFGDGVFDAVLIADTLHHVAESTAILAECLRVSQGPVIVKDHFFRNRWDRYLLRILDIGGNAVHGVESIHNYYTRESWERTLSTLSALEAFRVEEVSGQYPFPFQHMLGRNIQFVAKLIPGTQDPGARS